MAAKTKALLTDETMRRIGDYLSVIAGGKIDPSKLTYKDIQRIARSGAAADFFAIGDQIIATYSDTSGNTYDMPYDMVDFRNVVLETGESVPGIILQSHYATVEAVSYDNAEPDNTMDNSIIHSGYNRWSESGIRAWLNSSAGIGSWFGTTFERGGSTVTRRTADVAPKQHDSLYGFMRGLPEDFLAILKPIKVTTATNTVTDNGILEYTHDTFFLPSEENMYYTTSTVVTNEDGNWAYWEKRTGDRDANNTYSLGTIYALEDHTQAVNSFLRTVDQESACIVHYVSTNGRNFEVAATQPYRCTPCCAIC